MALTVELSVDKFDLSLPAMERMGCKVVLKQNPQLFYKD